MERSVSSRRKRWKWRLGVWLVLLGCIGLLAALLVEGLFNSADFALKSEAFAGFFSVGCVFLVASRRSGKKKADSK